MQMLTHKAAATYRRVDLEARIEASANGDLTRICLEEAVDALRQVVFALDRDRDAVVGDGLSRAHSIALYLARSVAPNHPMRSTLAQFYGGLADTIGHNMRAPRYGQIAQARDDFADLLAALDNG